MHPGVKSKEPDKMSPPKLFPVLLKKNYCPISEYEIIGYTKKAVERKNSVGQMIIVEPEEFIHGVMKPHPSPGVGFPNKIWAETKIRLPIDEAKSIIAKNIAERADDIAA
jgi:hypothetical protein